VTARHATADVDATFQPARATGVFASPALSRANPPMPIITVATVLCLSHWCYGLLVCVSLLTISSRPARAQRADTAAYHPETVSEYSSRIVGPRTLVRILALSEFDQATHRPREWDRTWPGFEDRSSSRLASGAIERTVVFTMSRAVDERQAEFTLCGCDGIGARLRHAALTSVRVNSPNGTHVSPLTPIAEMAGALLVTGVRPEGFSATEGLRGGLTAIGGHAVLYVARELWPWHRRPPGF
jgi:hypothetical protein